MVSSFGSPIHLTERARLNDCRRFIKSVYSLDRSLASASSQFLLELRELVLHGAFSIGDAYHAYLEFVRLTPGAYYGRALYFHYLYQDFDVPFSSHICLTSKDFDLWLKNQSTTASQLVEHASEFRHTFNFIDNYVCL